MCTCSRVYMYVYTYVYVCTFGWDPSAFMAARMKKGMTTRYDNQV